MPDQSSEADSRIIIDEALRLAGWDPSDKSQVATEVSLRTDRVDDSPAEFGGSPSRMPPVESKPIRRADYVLLDQQGRPLAVVEAKRRAIEPYSAKSQTLPYAQQLGAPFIFLTNGEVVYFWDHQLGDARIVTSFFSRRDLERLRDMRRTRVALATVEIPRYYQRQGETRELRPYQQDCLRAMDRALELGKRRFLAELPTGTGKTDIICQQIKRLAALGDDARAVVISSRTSPLVHIPFGSVVAEG